jgi:hypothetical protein
MKTREGRDVPYWYQASDVGVCSKTVGEPYVPAFISLEGVMTACHKISSETTQINKL